MDDYNKCGFANENSLTRKINLLSKLRKAYAELNKFTSSLLFLDCRLNGVSGLHMETTWSKKCIPVPTRVVYT
jgi:hypothetical protein